jgi:hypothetical protein
LDVKLPLFRDFGLREDGGDGTDRFTRVAVDTLLGMDEELVLVLVETLHRAYLYTGSIFSPDARLRDHVGHLFLLWRIRRTYYTSRLHGASENHLDIPQLGPIIGASVSVQSISK